LPTLASRLSSSKWALEEDVNGDDSSKQKQKGKEKERDDEKDNNAGSVSAERAEMERIERELREKMLRQKVLRTRKNSRTGVDGISESVDK